MQSMKAILLSAAALVVTAGLTGCDEILNWNSAQAQAKPQAQVQVQEQTKPPKATHHFEPLLRTGASLAIDTTTGMECRTWDWICTDGKGMPSVKGDIYGIRCEAIPSLPTCDELAKQ